MNMLSSALLGIIQGLTEFLPVSSSGHLVIIQSLIPGFSQPGILLDTILHFGTMVAVLLYFRKMLLSYINIRFITLLVVGTIPAVLVGILFKDQIELLFSSVKLVGVALLLSGIFNLLTDRFSGQVEKLTNKNAFVTGIAQALAIVPGISRSGSTIFASVAQGIKKSKAAEFSFILSLPAVFGANILEIYSNRAVPIENLSVYFVGFLAALVTGYLAISLVFWVIKDKKFEYFAYYCFVVGIITLIFLK